MSCSIVTVYFVLLLFIRKRHDLDNITPMKICHILKIFKIKIIENLKSNEPVKDYLKLLLELIHWLYMTLDIAVIWSICFVCWNDIVKFLI